MDQNAGQETQDDRPLAELLQRIADQSTELARKEVELAKAELELKAKHVGVGIGAFGGAGVVGLLALGALTATLILALATALDAWLAALIVTVAYAIVAGVMALAGRRKVERAKPPVPERAVENTKRDVETVKDGVREGINR